MLQGLTAAERRGAAILVGLLVIGACWDMWSASAPPAGSPGDQLRDSGSRRNREFEPGRDPGSSPPVAHAANGARLDLNVASAAELDALPGVGPVLAARIIDQRRRGGPFRRIEDLLAVRGVGPRLLARLRPHVRVEPVAPAVASPKPGVQTAVGHTRRLADSTSVPPSATR